MKKLIFILLFLPFWSFGQDNITLHPPVNANTLNGKSDTAFVSTLGDIIYNDLQLGTTAGRLLLPLNDDATAPTLGFGNSGLYESVDNAINLSLNGIDRWLYTPTLTTSYFPLTLGQSGGTSGQLNLIASDADVISLNMTTSDRLDLDGGDFSIDETKNLYYDGGGNTYRVESSADILDDYVGGVNVIRQTVSGASEIGYDIINNSELQNSLVGAYYNFDGASGSVMVADNVAIQNIFDNGGSVICRIYPRSTGESAGGMILSKGSRFEAQVKNEIAGFVKLRFFMDFDGTDGIWDLTNTPLPINKWSVIEITYDNSDVTNNPIFYINGEVHVSTEVSTPIGTRASDIGSSLAIGNRAADTRTWDGGIAMVSLLNRIHTEAEVKEISGWDSNNPPIWFSDVGASQVEQTSGTLEIGKRYRLNDWITNDDFTNIGGTNADGSEFITTGTTPTVWTNSSTVVLIGPVANYNASGIGHNTWMDASGNDLYGTVSSAIYTNIPASDVEEVRQDVITDDTQILSSDDILPDGYILKYMIYTETAGNTAIVDLGTTSGSSNVFSQETLTASSTDVIPIDFPNLTGADLPLYINDDGAGTWNSASVNLIFIIQKIK